MSVPVTILHLPLLIYLQLICSCGSELSHKAPRSSDAFIDGVTLVAPPKPFSIDPAIELRELGADWVAIIPYGFTPADEPMVYFNNSRQWWGETKEGIEETIRYCKNSQLKIMLKPQIWTHRMWSGDIFYDNEADWSSWEKGYGDYVIQMADIADSMGVEILCIGTELKKSVSQRPAFWGQLIGKVRSRYQGKITYAANWDSYQSFPFWNKLDYIGVNAYFPLSDFQYPKRKDLIRAWDPISSKIENLSQETGKSVLFTEFGYLSTDYNTHNTWEKEDRIDELQVNEESQALALDVLFECFYSQDWWEGGFIWKWYPSDYRIRNKAKDYTVQGKQAQQVLQKWYNK